MVLQTSDSQGNALHSSFSEPFGCRMCFIDISYCCTLCAYVEQETFCFRFLVACRGCYPHLSASCFMLTSGICVWEASASKRVQFRWRHILQALTFATCCLICWPLQKIINIYQHILRWVLDCWVLVFRTCRKFWRRSLSNSICVCFFGSLLCGCLNINRRLGYVASLADKAPPYT